MDENVCGREATMLTGRRWLRKDRRERRRKDAIEASRFSRIARNNQKTRVQTLILRLLQVLFTMRCASHKSKTRHCTRHNMAESFN